MAQPCKICKLPDEIREKIDFMLQADCGEADVMRLAKSEGYEITSKQIQNHRQVHLPKTAIVTVETVPTLTSCRSSYEMQMSIIAERAAQADRLIAQANQAPSVRIERLLMETTDGLFKMLADLPYETEVLPHE